MSAAAGLQPATVKNPEAMAPLIKIIDELYGSVRSAGRDDLGGRLGMVRARVSDTRVRLVVVGAPKSGMSTLVNTLVGAPISVTDSPAGVPVVVEYGPEPSATLVRSVDGGRTERQPVDPLDPLPALTAKDVVRLEFVHPAPLLAEGIVLMDAPGTDADDRGTWSMIAAADAVLYVVDAGNRLDNEQIVYLQRVQQLCPTVICVLNKIDRYPYWAQIQEENRQLLDAAGLAFAVAPVSAQLHREAEHSGDRQRAVESGIPQLLEHLREYVVANADAVATAAAVRDIRLVSDHLGMGLRSEAETLRDPQRRAEITQRLTAARDEADRLRQRSANWQIVLADGSTELMADIEHDLRHRLRGLVRDAEARIAKGDPGRRWTAFGSDLDGRIADAIEENFELAEYRAQELAEQVAAKFPADHRIPDLPDMRVDPAEVMEQVTRLEPLESGRDSILQQVLSVLRGSYGGLLMVGVATSLLGMSLVNWYSGTAGVLLGIHALWEDRRTRTQRRQAEAKVAVSRLMDDVIFQVGKESRNRLRGVQRALRDHFTEIATDTMRRAEEALRIAEEEGEKYGDKGQARLAHLDAELLKLRDLRQRADGLLAVTA
ncbi:dynamin family protein [Nocardia paucivorans]|uniref:dynamin family protein n=1 Tax=Nocardia paucivorans TaxID=114259 RepID=UPI0005928684|nr:dynamin family protein [Nocardia paucivorans]